MSPIAVKICGVTRVADARLAVQLGADFVGVNLWRGSPRYVSVGQAAAIAEAVHGRARLVGVWVNPTPAEVAWASDRLALDLLQFHGDEDPAVLEPFADVAIKAFRVGTAFHADLLSRFPRVWGFLFDCAVPGRYGGTGMAWAYESIAGLNISKPKLVAGGLRPSNVAQAILQSGADIVDVCSGVEAQPGIKDPERLRQFFERVRHAQEED